jgi:hypothetical protein
LEEYWESVNLEAVNMEGVVREGGVMGAEIRAISQLEIVGM